MNLNGCHNSVTKHLLKWIAYKLQQKAGAISQKKVSWSHMGAFTTLSTSYGQGNTIKPQPLKSKYNIILVSWCWRHHMPHLGILPGSLFQLTFKAASFE